MSEQFLVISVFVFGYKGGQKVNRFTIRVVKIAILLRFM